MANRMLAAAKKIEQIVEVLIKKMVKGLKDPLNYAQTVYKEAIKINTSFRQPQIADLFKENLIKKRQLIIRISNAVKAQMLRTLSIKALIKRISNNTGDKKRIYGIIIAR